MEVIALVNTGYETDVPEALVPIDVAERLGVWPRLPDGTLVETYRTASGLMKVYRVRGAKVHLVAKGVEPRPVDAYVVVSEFVDETLISDQLASRLGIVIEDPAQGIWRLRGEAKLRKSEA